MAERKTRSVRIHRFGGPEVLEIEDTVARAPDLGEVRLDIRAIGINRTEATLRSGRSPIKPALPALIGWEAAGVIDEVGPNVENWRRGDRVALVPAYGAAKYALYSEVAIAPARSLVAIPDSQAFEHAAATWAAFGTAWAGLISIGNLKQGHTVLISAASSSVGLAAIQTARRVGARPIALTRTSQKSHELRAHGAEAVVAVDEVDAVQEVKELTGGKGAELVFDTVGGPGFSKLAEATATGGMLILYGALSTEPTVIPPFQVFARDLTIRGFAFPSIAGNDVRLTEVKRFVGEGISNGSFVPAISRTFKFDEIVEAHRFLESGMQIGKIVVSV